MGADSVQWGTFERGESMYNTIKGRKHIMMLHFIDNLYYRFYKLIMALGEGTIPRYNAVLLLSILTILNFITAIVFIMIITRKIIIVDLPKGYLFVIGFFIIALNSYRVFGKNRYEIIEDRFKDEGKESKIRNNLLALAYVILTILLLMASLIYLNNNPIIKRV